jgi:hypothetical protein
MKQVLKIREDGTFDFSYSIVTDVDVEGYGEPDPKKHYKDDGTEMTEEELEVIRNSLPPKSPLEEAHDTIAQLKHRLQIAETAVAETADLQQQTIEKLVQGGYL